MDSSVGCVHDRIGFSLKVRVVEVMSMEGGMEVVDVDVQRSYPGKCGHVDVHQRSLRSSSPLLSAQVWCPYNEAAGGGFGGGSASKPKSTSSSGAAAASSSAYPANGMVAAASRGVGVGKSSAAAGPSRKRQRVEDVSSGEDGDFGQDAAPLCSWSGSYGDLLSGHLSECPLHIIKCPSGCGADIKRHDIEKHLRKVCKKSFEYCTICGEAVRPGMMQEHR